MRRWFLIASGVLAAVAACTQNFDQFTVGGPDGGAGMSSAGMPGIGGAGGVDPDASMGGMAGGLAGAGAGGMGGAAMCPMGTKDCGGTCVLETNPEFGCASASCDPCNTNNATAACDTTGACTISSCQVGFEDCNSDPSDGCEASTSTDPNNCGACGNLCFAANATPRCTAGQCGIESCDAGWEDCDGLVGSGCERNVSADPTACGSCTNDCTAMAGDWECNSGSCEVSTCPSGFRDCDGDTANGCETDVRNSGTHCGFCGNSCDAQNATTSCNAGTCEITSCDGSFEDCDGIANNGCEIDSDVNVEHCGGCDRACDSDGVVTRLCASGVCTSSCSPGLGNCSQPGAPAPDDGCETDLTTDVDNCGSCARPCANVLTTSRSCSGGVCDSACVSGRANCSLPLAPATDDGCETDPSNDESHCGGCGRACSPTGVDNLFCTGGLCESTCTGSLGNCSKPAFPQADDGCEANFDNDPTNCGQCGRACSGTNTASLACDTGVCTSSCAPGFGNCLTPSAPLPDDGCETNTATNVDNCGGCGRACSSGAVTARSCGGGVCTSSCISGRGNCSQPLFPTADDGCETDVTIDIDNCGGCGRACSGAGVSNRSCQGSVCNSSCSTGANCSQPTFPTADDGCETDVLTDVNNCGACGRACSGFQVASLECSSGQCTPFCDPGFDDCNTPTAPSPDNGCETGVNQTGACGSCDNDCSDLNNMACVIAPTVCGCNNDSDCEISGGDGTCRTDGRCECDLFGSNTVLCQPGEGCIPAGGFDNDCSCNGGNDCASNEVCCDSPAGCRNLSTDASNCGACGHECPSGFACVAGECRCDSASDCNAGSPGTCNGSGRCVCGNTCGVGQRCQADGTCG